MNLEMALEYFKQLKESGESQKLGGQFNTALLLAIMAMEEVIDICKDERSMLGMFCPNCRTGVKQYIRNSKGEHFEVHFCPFCGQKLNWEK